IESVSRNLSPNGQFTTKSARELIRFKCNRLNGRSCHRGLFIFQSMCSFSNEDCDHLFKKNLTKVHEKLSCQTIRFKNLSLTAEIRLRHFSHVIICCLLALLAHLKFKINTSPI
ncbi:hypothetical protein NC651_037207, partial [Populus alba x Populus x berolinensis]